MIPKECTVFFVNGNNKVQYIRHGNRGSNGSY